MNMTRALHLLWLLPAYFAGMIVYQLVVLKGLDRTYTTGESLLATVTDFDIKQIAAQTNGYVDLEFIPSTADTVRERLTLSVQLAAGIMEAEVVPIRYDRESFEPIVMTAAYALHRRVVITNIAMLAFGCLASIAAAVFASRLAWRRAREPKETLLFETA